MSLSNTFIAFLIYLLASADPNEKSDCELAYTGRY